MTGNLATIRFASPGWARSYSWLRATRSTCIKCIETTLSLLLAPRPPEGRPSSEPRCMYGVRARTRPFSVSTSSAASSRGRLISRLTKAWAITKLNCGWRVVRSKMRRKLIAAGRQHTWSTTATWWFRRSWGFSTMTMVMSSRFGGPRMSRIYLGVQCDSELGCFVMGRTHTIPLCASRGLDDLGYHMIWCRIRVSWLRRANISEEMH